jgi:23S rRNA pseudouridine1911/1915/1917 synthase
MAVVTAGKPAVSHYEITERFVNFTRLNVRLESGRTHQIRVHMAHIKFPVLGDPVYLRRSSLRKGMAESLRTMLQQFQRQALHAARLRLVHPQSGECCEWSVEPPADHLALLDELRSSAAWDDQ